MKGPALRKLAISGIVAGVLGGGAMLYSRWADRRALKAAAAEGAFIEIGATRFHYLDRGSGPPIVMIHGVGTHMRNFSYSLLERLIDTHRVILIDRPGAGHSAMPQSAPIGIIEQAAATADLLRALDVEQPLIVGHSFGGAVALALGLNAPDRVCGLALLAPLTQHVDAIPEAVASLVARGHVIRRGAARTIGVPAAQLLARRFRANAFAPEAMPADFHGSGTAGLALTSSSLDATVFEVATINRDLRLLVPRYADLAVPTSVLFGRDDQVLDPAIHGASLVAQNPAVELELMSGGHMFPVTAPDVTARWIKSRIRAAQGSPSSS